MRHSIVPCARSVHTALLIVPCLFLLARPMVTVGTAQGRIPTATLVEAAPLALPGAVDSNSPAVWELVTGQRLLHVLTSFGGRPSVSSGPRLSRMVAPQPVEFLSHPGHGVWMEALVAAEAGTFYGYYHNEVPADFCGRPDRVTPRIGAARSTDRGRSWEDLGIILEAPFDAHHCGTPNTYFVGGVGDHSVILDPESKDLYLFFSQYSRSAAMQGIGVARVPWAHRDDPTGKVDVWVDGVWLSAATSLLQGLGEDVRLTRQYRAATPLVRPARPWHDADPETDAFWGAAVHWNTSLQQYVMLLNRTRDEGFGQEGIYVSFARTLDDPRLWSTPQRILRGGSWYPQVMGIEPGLGTDKVAAARARFFMNGRSDHLIDFRYR